MNRILIILTALCLVGCASGKTGLETRWEYVCFDFKTYNVGHLGSKWGIMSPVFDVNGKHYACEKYCKDFPNKCK